MKKVEAYWEKQNLNKNVLEVYMDDNDTVSCLSELEDDYNSYDYIVVKVPKPRIDLVHGLEDAGFRYMETQMEMRLNLKSISNSPAYVQSVSDHIQLQEIDNMERLKELLTHIDENLFTTDRVSLDPKLGSHFTPQRYKNWITDSFLKGKAIIIEATINSNPIGFYFLLEGEYGTIHAILCGLFENYRRASLGISFTKKLPMWSAKQGYSKMVLNVSSNNLEALRVYSYIGFEIKKINYVLRKTI